MHIHKKSKIIFNNKMYSSKELLLYISAIEHDLLGTFGKSAFRVAILLDRSIELCAAILAVLNTKGTYIILEPSLPENLVQYVLSDANVDGIVLSTENESELYFDKKIININNIEIKHRMFLRLRPSMKDIAYIVYTSGTTGVPKGVEITHCSLKNLISGVSEIIDFTPGMCIACLTASSFDIFFLESIMALSKGLTVVMANKEEQSNPRLIAKLIEKNNVNMIQMTPSRLQLMLNYDQELCCLKNMKVIMIGGEPFPLKLLQVLQEKTSAKIYNMYGPTETTVWSTISDVTRKKKIDIGRPIKNTEVFIINSERKILPPNQIGEICIAGKGVAKGYVNNDDLTAKSFSFLPQKPKTRVYFSGDLGRYLDNGDIEYMGRIDNQLKIRGYRIEPEQIEFHLNQFGSIKQSLVVVEKSETDKALKALYTSDSRIDHKELTEYLFKRLPEYMIPAHFVRVESFIYTKNGKLDRNRAIECVAINDSLANEFVTYQLNETQNKAFDIIRSSLNGTANEITIDTSFVDVGIDSITFIKIIVALENEFSFEFEDELLSIERFPTIKTMIEYIEYRMKLRSLG